MDSFIVNISITKLITSNTQLKHRPEGSEYTHNINKLFWNIIGELKGKMYNILSTVHILILLSVYYYYFFK